MRGVLRACQEKARAAGMGLRIKLHLGKIPALVNLPWEFLFDPDLERFLVHSAATPLVRYVDLPTSIPVLKTAFPIRILGLIANPNDADLDLAGEKAHLEKALGPLLQSGLVMVDWLEHATLPALQDRLRQQAYHILHFLGEGGYDTRIEQGALLLEDEQGTAAWAAAEKLGVLLHDHPSLRLVVLNACFGARNGAKDPFASVAATLVRQGLPAVIAMQFEVSDEAALVSANVFYRALAQGFPVDAALAEARKAIFVMPEETEWGTPALYLRAADGVLFDLPGGETANQSYNQKKFEQDEAEKAKATAEAEHQKTLKSYLKHQIAIHQNLRLQGIRAGSQPLAVALEKVYISLNARDRQAGERSLGNAPEAGIGAFSGELSIGQAMRRHTHLAVIGDPGCGKTTLLAYLALTYARELLEPAGLIQQRLGLTEPLLPITLPLRDLGRHLKESHPDPGQDGPGVLLGYLHGYYANQNIQLPKNFFDADLESGRAFLLLDGMDELSEKGLRGRAARLIEKFIQCYPQCRCVVTSREVGYEGAARLGEGFGLAEVRDFSPAQVRKFIHDWTLAVETTLADSAAPIHPVGRRSGRALDFKCSRAMGAWPSWRSTRCCDGGGAGAPLSDAAPRAASELYEEAVEVLLGNWDGAKGLQTVLEVAGRELDAGDRRSLLEPVAFWLHERKRREIELDELRDSAARLSNHYRQRQSGSQKSAGCLYGGDQRTSGLLVDRGTGEYGFAHLTFQEYLAARALADRDDSIEFTIKVLNDPWWSETILLQVGYLSTQGKTRATRLIQAIMDAHPGAQANFEHLLLAAECVIDAGPARLEGDLLGAVRRRLQPTANAPIKKGK